MFYLFFLARNGKLKPGDQIVAIDRNLFSEELSQEDAINILQSANGIIHLVVARESAEFATSSSSSFAGKDEANVKRTLSEVSGSSKDSNEMVLNTEWSQLEVIEFDNDGAGFGFGIVGGRSSGVIVKTLLPGGVASKVCFTIY